MTKTGSARRALLAPLALLIAVATAACGGNDGPAPTDKPVVVASTDVWASVASAVGGEHADVSALYTSPDGDPHEFEPSSADTARVQDANLIVMNGDHYDHFMEEAAADAKGAEVVAADVRSDKTRGNEHVFYDLAAVADTANAIANELAEIAPANAAYYRDRAGVFNSQINGLRAALADIKAHHDGAEVASTEPLAAAVLTDAGLVDIAPPGFVDAVEQGQSPSAADRAKFDDLLTQHRAKVLIYNRQAVNPSTQAVLDTARKAGIPVVEFTESLPEGVTDYIAWQRGQIDALAKALNG
ncbi:MULTISPECIES: metal ABC transporter solute-binding protein, Zn/Mn family [Gordonia]|uniref:Putative ABC transporter substrate-binding protein n=1 Tax=Gordonia sihwensis NBRC 108236 TaxID=1223544 RepID=L7LGF0_9ACTN|nr:MULTISPECIES: zinc ABC transporter substrate-binding protein [Gordonia]AUH67082.1 ABC transporter substrate-binding protein [Gordonia sp. YC-JH1]MBY4569169.1 ABC transporter substrate-binding protein [Gordonia sihwensis]GAC59133.1 putative ABC transporter substrate-binding protein [Gordonia sihwensis NBRC 108236]